MTGPTDPTEYLFYVKKANNMYFHSKHFYPFTQKLKAINLIWFEERYDFTDQKITAIMIEL